MQAMRVAPERQAPPRRRQGTQGAARRFADREGRRRSPRSHRPRPPKAACQGRGRRRAAGAVPCDRERDAELPRPVDARGAHPGARRRVDRRRAGQRLGRRRRRPGPGAPLGRGSSPGARAPSGKADSRSPDAAGRAARRLRRRHGRRLRRRRRASAWPRTRAGSLPGDVVRRVSRSRRPTAGATSPTRSRAARVAVVSDDAVDDVAGVVRVRCADAAAPARPAWRRASRAIPSAALTLVGVTGTNGKTTTTYLLEGIWRAAGLRTGVIGTIAYRVGDDERPAPFTTPEAPELQGLLAEMRRPASTHVADGGVVARAGAATGRTVSGSTPRRSAT